MHFVRLVYVYPNVSEEYAGSCERVNPESLSEVSQPMEKSDLRLSLLPVKEVVMGSVGILVRILLVPEDGPS